MKTASMDLTAAFNVLNVDLLLKRLKIMGIPNDVIQLITAWLKDRLPPVGSTCSEHYSVDFGSGQGSILGQVLFNYNIILDQSKAEQWMSGSGLNSI
jgi:hypothetical protein